MQIINYGCFILFLFFNITANAKVVHSINQIGSQIHNKDGQDIFADEMSGDTLSNGFGGDFWSTQSKLKYQEILSIVDSQDTNEKWGFVGMKAWPGQKNYYIVTAYSIRPFAQQDNHQMDGDADPRNKIIVAVVNYDGAGLPKLVGKPYKEKIINDRNEDFNNDDSFSKSAFNLKDNDGIVVIGNLQRLDFAPYHLNSQILAFGIRFGIRNSYIRGESYNQSMTLFALINNQLRPILKTKMGYYKDMLPPLNGDGRAVGSDKEEYREYILSMLSHQTNGFYDIQYIKKGSHGKGTIYHWNNKKNQYQ